MMTLLTSKPPALQRFIAVLAAVVLLLQAVTPAIAVVQAELTYERFYANEEEDEEELVYNIAWSHWLPSNWIPIAELNGVTGLGESHQEGEEELAVLKLASGGAESEEDTLISATLGFRYAFGNGQQWGAGVQFPISGSEAYDYRLVIGGIIHFN